MSLCTATVQNTSAPSGQSTVHPGSCPEPLPANGLAVHLWLTPRPLGCFCSLLFWSKARPQPRPRMPPRESPQGTSPRVAQPLHRLLQVVSRETLPRLQLHPPRQPHSGPVFRMSAIAVSVAQPRHVRSGRRVSYQYTISHIGCFSPFDRRSRWLLVFTCNNLAISQSNCTSIVDVGCYCPK